jgi:hypothetical protein
LRASALTAWIGDERAIRFARAATTALQMACWFGAQINWLCGQPEKGVEPDPWPGQLAAQHHISVPDLMSGWASNFTLALDLGDEARQFATKLF